MNDEAREAYDDRQMDGLVAEEEEWRARATYCVPLDVHMNPVWLRRWEEGRCIHAARTGDGHWPVSCERDQKYAKLSWCETRCPYRRAKP